MNFVKFCIFAAGCSAVAQKGGNFDRFGSNRPVELAGHNIGNFLIDFKIREERYFCVKKMVETIREGFKKKM